jgi:hypothetical protein
VNPTEKGEPKAPTTTKQTTTKLTRANKPTQKETEEQGLHSPQEIEDPLLSNWTAFENYIEQRPPEGEHIASETA